MNLFVAHGPSLILALLYKKTDYTSFATPWPYQAKALVIMRYDAVECGVYFVGFSEGALGRAVREIVWVGAELVVILRPGAGPDSVEFPLLVHDIDIGLAGVDTGRG
jgi:hypothetical protein